MYTYTHHSKAVYYAAFLNVISFPGLILRQVLPNTLKKKLEFIFEFEGFEFHYLGGKNLRISCSRPGIFSYREKNPEMGVLLGTIKGDNTLWSLGNVNRNNLPGMLLSTFLPQSADYMEMIKEFQPFHEHAAFQEEYLRRLNKRKSVGYVD